MNTDTEDVRGRKSEVGVRSVGPDLASVPRALGEPVGPLAPSRHGREVRPYPQARDFGAWLRHCFKCVPARLFYPRKNLRERAPCLAAIAATGIAATALAAPAEIWVSPDGNDAAAGTREAPLASPALAVRKARDLRRTSPTPPADGVRIVLRGGTYSLDRTLFLRPEDSGTVASPTAIEAASGERPVLSGGVAITGWSKPTAKIARLPEAAQSYVWIAPLPEFHGRTLEFRQLWIDGKKAIRARTPNEGAMERLTHWDRAKEEAGFPAALVAGLGSPRGAEMLVQQQWEIAVLRLRTVRTEGAEARVTFQQPESRIEFEHPWPQPITKAENGSGAFFLVNAPEFLDAPGEWYADTAAGLVYLWPRDGEDLSHAEVVAPAVETLVQVLGTLDRPVQHVTLRGISFAHATWLRPSLQGHVPLQAGMFFHEAYKLRPPGTPDWRSLDNQAWLGRAPAGVAVRGARHLRIEGCRFERMAMSGLDLASGTQDAVVEGCVFRDLGNNGVQLGAFGDDGTEAHLPYDPRDEREVVARVRYANNFVTDTANEDYGGVAICAGYVRDTTIEHNEVDGTSYTGISLGWGWTRTPNAMARNRVHANRLTRIATRMCDDAGIYTLSFQPGTIVSENVVKAITMSPWVDRPDHWFYLYTDEGSSFITVRDNWCPEEKFLKNATGPGNLWERNGPSVPATIKDAAGLEPSFRHLRKE